MSQPDLKSEADESLPIIPKSSLDFMENLLRNEFPPLFDRHSKPEYNPPKAATAVVVLSAKGDGDNDENVVRIRMATEIFFKISANLANNLARESQYSYAQFVINGETEQLFAMRRIAMSCGILEKFIVAIDCGRRGVGNTKTQFQQLAANSRFCRMKNLVLVSSDYHGPRLNRMRRYLPDVNIDFVLAPWVFTIEAALRLSAGEARRICEYSASGDIDSHPYQITLTK